MAFSDINISKDIFNSSSTSNESFKSISENESNFNFNASIATNSTLSPSSNCLFTDQLALYDRIAELQQALLQKEETINQLQSQIDSYTKVNSRQRKKTPVCVSVQTDIVADQTEAINVETDNHIQPTSVTPPPEYHILALFSQLNRRMDMFEAKLSDWEEGAMHDMYVRMFKPNPTISSPAPPITVPSVASVAQQSLSHNGSPIAGASQDTPPLDPIISQPSSQGRPSASVESSSVSDSCANDQPSQGIVAPYGPTFQVNLSSVPSPETVNGKVRPTGVHQPSMNSTGPSSPSPPSSCKSVLVIGDSIIKHLNCQSDGFKFHKKCLKGSTISRVSDFVKDFQSPVSHDVVYIHCGTNSIHVNKFGYISNSSEILDSYSQLFTVIRNRFPSSRVIISGILFRRDLDYNSLCCLNDFIHGLCRSSGFIFVDPSSRLTPSVLGRDGLHLNRSGSFHFTKLVTGICLDSLKDQRKN